MPNELIDFLRLFRDIPEADAQVIIAAAECRSYKEGDYLFQADKICREIFFIRKGVLRIVTFNDDSKEVTHFFSRENQFCTILNSFNNGMVARESIQAACDVKLFAITRKGLDSLYAAISYFNSLITQITHQALLDKIAIRNGYLGQDSTTRYKTFMLRQPEIALRVSMADIASYLGITPQSLSRIRKSIR